MPGFFRKLFGLRPKSKPKVNVPSFKSAEEYSLWRNKTYGEPLPQKMLEAQEAARKKRIRDEELRQISLDNMRDRQAQKKANNAQPPKSN